MQRLQRHHHGITWSMQKLDFMQDSSIEVRKTKSRTKQTKAAANTFLSKELDIQQCISKPAASFKRRVLRFKMAPPANDAMLKDEFDRGAREYSWERQLGRAWGTTGTCTSLK